MKQINIFKKFTSVILTIAVGIMSVPAITVNAQENGVQTPDSPSNSSEVQVQDNSSNVVAAEASNVSNGGDFTVDNIEYTISDEAAKTCYVSGNDLTEGTAVTIKATVINPNNSTEYSVTGIGDEAFGYCGAYLTSITIPDSVTSIGKSAFISCTYLTSATIGSGVKSIGDSAFHYCGKLTSITIPASVTSIGEGAFSGCTSLPAIGVATGSQSYTSDNGVLLSKDGKTLLAYPAGKTDVTEYAIPNTVTSIGDYAFEGCNSLTSVTIDSSSTSSQLTSIGKEAFHECNYLTSITIPDSVESIGEGAFFACTSLKSIEIPNSVTNIGNMTFYGCTDLISATIGNKVESIGEWAFACCGLTSIIIPSSVTSIGEGAFGICTSLPAIDVATGNNNYKSEGGVLFSKDGTLLHTYPAGKTGDSYTIPSSVTSIGGYAFEICTGLKSITIPDSVTSIGGSAFCNCSGLKSITIPDSVTIIGWDAFSDCAGLTSVTIGNKVESIGNYAFNSCSNLKYVLFATDRTDTKWGDGVFYSTPLVQSGSGAQFHTTQAVYDSMKNAGIIIPDDVFKRIDKITVDDVTENPPANLKAQIESTSGDTATIKVSWDAVASNGIVDGYQVQKSADGTDWENVADFTAGANITDNVKAEDISKVKYRVACSNIAKIGDYGTEDPFSNMVLDQKTGAFSDSVGVCDSTPTPDGGGGGANMADTSSSGSVKTGDNTMASVVGLTALVGLGVVAMLRKRRK